MIIKYIVAVLIPITIMILVTLVKMYNFYKKATLRLLFSSIYLFYQHTNFDNILKNFVVLQAGFICFFQKNLYNKDMNINQFLINNGFSIFGFEIRYYGIIIATAMLIAIFMARKLCKARNIDPDEIFILAIIVLQIICF